MIIVTYMATSKKQPKKQAVKKAPAKKTAAKKQPAKKQAKKAEPKKKARKTATAAVDVNITYTPSASNIMSTANETAYKVTEAVTKAVDTTIIRVQDVAKKTLRQKMLAWFKR